MDAFWGRTAQHVATVRHCRPRAPLQESSAKVSITGEKCACRKYNTRSRVLCAVVDRVAKPERRLPNNDHNGLKKYIGEHGSKRLAHGNARQGRNRRRGFLRAGPASFQWRS